MRFKDKALDVGLAVGRNGNTADGAVAFDLQGQHLIIVFHHASH
ncbi:hypothetical protein SDC9_171384 [bioreactor metagenome]|uniref:Uncharacterized protein n=1 Tax=bioreactor metagenome TaxID=1076179 RepID=A0A645GAR2_9ZZZZ